ncbi:MAG: GNAT family N-acetyltransferase [Acidimicrobiales bacterium]
MPVDIRPIVEEELDSYVESVVRGFGGEVQEGEQDRVRRVLGLDRTHAAFDERNRIVGTSGSYALSMAVPGRVDVATAGLTRITVATSHRRQGILTALIDDHFDEAAANDEPLSALWASEVAIYGRFGYGPATENLTLSYDARLAGVRRPDDPDTIDLVDGTEAEKALPDIRERGRVDRPGQYRRSPLWWEVRCFPDHEWMRDGASPRRYAIAYRDGDPVGYLSYRQKQRWTDNDLPDGELRVSEIIGVDTRAVHSLWWFLSNVDLFPKVSAWLQPVDCLVPWLAANPRAVKRTVTDGIHVRVLDVEAALSARRYDSPGELILAVTDDSRPAAAGTFRLSVSDDGSARCSATDEKPDAHLSAYAVGGLYLGGCRPEPLVVAGHLRAEQPIVDRIRKMFTWPVAPFCDEGF